MPISRILGAGDVCRRGDPSVRVSDAKQMRVIIVGDQRQHRPLTSSQVKGKTAQVTVRRFIAEMEKANVWRRLRDDFAVEFEH